MAVSTRTLLIVGGVVVGALVLEGLSKRPTATGGAATAGGPTGFSASGGYLYWQPVTGATYYEVQPTTSAGSPQGAPVQTSVADIQLASLPSGTQYVIVRGCNSMACGPWSAVQAVTLAAQAPGAVDNISAAENSDGSVTITWTVPQGAAYTELQHTDGSGNLATSSPITVNGTQGQDFQIDAPGNSVTVTGLYTTYSGAVFHFRLRACN